MACRTQVQPLLVDPRKPKLRNRASAIRLSDLLRFAQEKNTKFDVATSSAPRTVAGHENRPALRGTLVLKTEMGDPARTSLTAPSSVRQTARGRIVSGTKRVSAELRRHGVTARSWTREDLISTSALRTPAREKKMGRLRAAFVAPHVSKESLALQALRRLRHMQGPLLVDFGRSFLSTIRGGDTQVAIVSSSTERVTVILSSNVDPSNLRGTDLWYSFIRRRCLKKHSMRGDDPQHAR